MKKLILLIILIFSTLIVPAAGHCDYAIHLKNGGRFLTPRYWEQDQEIKFYIAGGVMGIEKNSVRKIERSTIDLDGIYEVKRPEKRPAQAEPEASMPGIPGKEGKELAKDDAKKDATIMGEFKALEKRFESRKNMSIDELSELKNELTVLRNIIVSSQSEEDYREEISKINDMRFLLTDHILLRKAKNQ
jgi:hypothetical protein